MQRIWIFSLVLTGFQDCQYCRFECFSYLSLVQFSLSSSLGEGLCVCSCARRACITASECVCLCMCVRKSPIDILLWERDEEWRLPRKQELGINTWHHTCIIPYNNISGFFPLVFLLHACVPDPIYNTDGVTSYVISYSHADCQSVWKGINIPFWTAIADFYESTVFSMKSLDTACELCNPIIFTVL